MAAFDAVEAIILEFPFLAELGTDIYNILVDGIVNNEPMEVVIQQVRDSEAYKTRFKGLTARRQAGLPAISEAEYLDIESGYLSQLREFNQLGVLGLSDRDPFRDFAAEMIGADVSVAELNRRLDRATGLANESSDQIQQAFQDFYGAPVSDDALVAYFLDPNLGLNEIENQLAAASIGGAAIQRGLSIDRARAEILHREGVTADLARQGFADIAREQPVLARLARIHEVTPLSQMELEQFFFHEDTEVAARRNRTFSQALATFQAGGAGVQRSREGGLAELLERNPTV